MTYTLSTTQPRTIRALDVAANSGQWLRVMLRNGNKAWGVPSSKDAGQFYLTTSSSCTCYDSRQAHMRCKHMLAVKLREVLAAV